jgi:hypothetical protein
MVCYIGVQSQNPPVADSPDSDRETPTENSQAAQHNSAAIPNKSPIPGANQQFSSSERTQYGNRKESETEQEWMWPPSLGWAAVFVAAVSALATIFYAFILWGQWLVIRTQNRPWIMVTPDKPEGWPPAGTGSCTFRLRWSVENVGKSPAFLTQLWANVVVLPYPVPSRRLDCEEDRDFAEFVPTGDIVTKRTGFFLSPRLLLSRPGINAFCFTAESIIGTRSR